MHQRTSFEHEPSTVEIPHTLTTALAAVLRCCTGADGRYAALPGGDEGIPGASQVGELWGLQPAGVALRSIGHVGEAGIVEHGVAKGIKEENAAVAGRLTTVDCVQPDPTGTGTREVQIVASAGRRSGVTNSSLEGGGAERESCLEWHLSDHACDEHGCGQNRISNSLKG
jgi:hypothetical protein